MRIYLISIYTILCKKAPTVMVTAAFVLLLLTAPEVRSQIAVGEVNGSFSSNNQIRKFHGYIVFLELSSHRFTPLVTNGAGSCSGKYNVPISPTYTWAQQVGAFLALNGSFIDPEAEYKPGDCRLVFGPVKSSGAVVAPPIPRPDGAGNPALLFSKDATATIKMATKADVDTAYYVVSGQWEAGPQEGSNGSLLIGNGTEMGASALPVPDAVAPRTAVGLTQDGILILLMIEGRLPDSDGITLPYLARLLRVCGAYNAVNLDGGGSSTITYVPDRHIPMRESPALYNLMKANQSDKSPYFNITQRDPRIAFTSRPSSLISPSGQKPMNLLYRPSGIHFGFALRPARRK